jgi:uncharacterized FlaG/YvyC family protein
MIDIKSTGSVNLIKAGVATSKVQSTKAPEPPKAEVAKADTKVPSMPESQNLVGQKAVFSLQDNKHVVIQFLDKNGEVIKQIPPKAVVEAYERLKELTTSDLNNEA